jgi:hypothetical protein
MAEKSRGIVLTIFAVLFALMALSNFSKPLHMSPNAGFVFFGTKLTGTPNLIIAPLFGILLAAYAYGIWTMRKFAMPIAHFYATYVVLNLLLFTINNRGTARLPPLAGSIAYVVVAVGVSLGAAVMLTRRKSDLT